MYIPAKANSLTSTPNWIQTLDGVCKKTAYELNCVRIGIVQTFYPEDLTVDVLIANKKTVKLNKDGTQVTADYPLIRAKVVYCNPFETFPISEGDECVMLFSDREIESWFINGGVNPEGYPRMHEKTDAVAIFGIRSLPKMISILTDALHLFYGASEIILKQAQTDINTTTLNLNATDININGTLTINGQPYLDHTHSNGNLGNPTGGVIV